MFKVLMIKWEDPCFASDGWMPTQDFLQWIKEPPPQTISVGVLVHENESFIVISQSFGERQIADSIKITKSAIKECTEIAQIPLSIEIPSENSF
jgi:hypothetical protein